MSHTLTYCPPFELLDLHLRKHGRGSMAFSSLQPNMKYYLDRDLGYFAFLHLPKSLWAPKGLNVIIGDPICDPADFQDLLAGYSSLAKNENTAFIHLSENYARKLSDIGYKVNEIGVEHMLEIQPFDMALTGSKFSQLRRWRNKALSSGIVVRELPFHEICLESLEAVSSAWLNSKGGSELIGLNRPLRIEDKKDVRYFWAFKDEKLVGFAVYDPMYRDNQIYGYIHNIARIVPDAPHGTNDLIVLEALKAFQEEKLEILSLGLSPLAEITDESFESQRTFSVIFKFMFNRCQFVYPFKGNYFHKTRYRCRKEKVYFALTPKSGLFGLIGVFKALQVF